MNVYACGVIDSVLYCPYLFTGINVVLRDIVLWTAVNLV